MGRLFWKFFLCIMLAQVTATIGIGGTFWLKNRAAQQERALDIDTSPPAQMIIEAASATLEAGGAQALRQFLGKLERMRVFAVDAKGQELMGRAVHPAMLAKARAMLEQSQAHPVVRDAAGSDGKRYLLFLPSSERFRNAEAGAARDTLIAVAMSGPRAMGPGPRPHEAGAPPPRGEFGRGPPRMDTPYRNFIPLGAAIAASLLFAFLLAWYFARPIRDLRQAFEAASHGNLAPRFHASGKRGDELTDLGRDFDRMTGRLRNLMDSQTRLLHDVSHELRSPLARLQAAIGLAHQQPEKMATSMQRIERESERMDKLIGELLTLSRLEAGAGNTHSEDVGIADLVHDIVDDARYEARARQLDIALAGDAATADACVTGQPELLARAVENVVRNAIKHSPDGGTVNVELSRQTGWLRIAVLDRGPGVASADLARIFEPFFRSSNTQHSTDGHGLGLAIAQHVISAHGGRIGASLRSGGGLCVEMLLPVKTPG
ncbi:MULTISPECIES: ATP-binding protein [unclassified Janthinobacterium]|uniref:sensor histidine kinase n=1 Tax=unclassified Janthinobacterium TaxID=2610881 RepID=UPI001E564661|nr:MULTISPECIES: ATP-binding protein [unclassified Janthinobacterium]MCC7644466.1 HAMP domain-containing protein [Janthinobacterium sp. EB271-G4-3-1]MCC7694002.1 HAMP domain-containing protein [Janthinobacterium sp. EB271-G4-3-2]